MVLHETRPSTRVKALVERGGWLYLALYSTRWTVERLGELLDRRLVGIEQRRRLVEPWSVSARRFTVDDNKRLWNTYDWSRRGEEWTRDERWKHRVIDQFLVPNVPLGAVVLEVGPGGGRWTEVLQSRAAKLYVVDVAERAIELCRERFVAQANIEYQVGDGSSLDLAASSIDAVWSYDVFVHINPVNVRSYFREFRRVLRPGGRAVIHHPGEPGRRAKDRPGWRSDVTNAMVVDFARENDLHVVAQTQDLVNEGDVLTVLEKSERIGPHA